MLTYFITGASRGIGHEFVLQILSQGHKVIATARAPGVLEKEFGDRALILSLDVTKQNQVDDLAHAVNSPIDVLINNAGVLLGEDAPFQKVSSEKLFESFNVNTLGAIRVTQALLPHLQKSPQAKVINITSKMGSIEDNGSGGYYGYRMSKAALNMFTKSFAVDFPKITTLCLHPGWVQTDMGGANALVRTEDSVRGLLKVIQRAKPSDSGGFFDFTGEEISW